ncbi:hypothetical protein [Peribacillus simplex]|uniref:hypothetical protein n=1 Tax=Peribacillus simplex TaxID=1478 RepID=UPI003D2A8DAD
MIINKIAIGNDTEAFIEDRFVEGINLISSDDNNKGKTILIQGMMYALGNVPTFPVSFHYKDYYYIIEFTMDDTLYKICRYKDDFILKANNELRHFENTSEFRRYWDKVIFKLPQITKNNKNIIVHPELFLQLFFVGQDKKNTSTIANGGYYKKEDFINMLYRICGIENPIDVTEIEKQKQLLSKYNHEKKLLLKQHKILSSKKKELAYFSTTNDRIQFKNNLEKIEKVNDSITELNKERNRNIARKMKCETAIKEIISLNRDLDTGEIVCLSCGSVHIGYKTASKKGYAFDITTADIRKEIINSIHNKINDYEEEIERINISISDKQNILRDLLSVEEVSLESLLLYKEDLFNASDADKKITDLDIKINEIKSVLSNFETIKKSKAETEKEILERILEMMNSIYKEHEPAGTLKFENLFTKKSETYSGSEQTIFYLLKMYVFQKVTKHSYPIIVDSFRSEDLSTEKEKIFLELFNELENQIIFTTTLKVEEVGKYDREEFKFINHIDYSDHTPSSILKSEYRDYFNTILNEIIQ